MKNKKTSKKGMTLIEWYVQNAKEDIIEHPEQKEAFIKKLQNDEEFIVQAIMKTINQDIIVACMETEEEIIIFDDAKKIGKDVLEALKKEFLSPDGTEKKEAVEERKEEQKEGFGKKLFK